MDDTTPAPADAAVARRAIIVPRLRAAGIHFALSAVIFAVALYLILAHWYPGFHFTVDGGWQGVRIMVFVDLVLGPLLTLIVFDSRKARRLIAFDLACIGAVQLAALAWGFYAVHSQRPVAISHLDGTFHSVTAAPFTEENIDLAQVEALSPAHPPVVHVAPAAGDEEETRKTMMELVSGFAEWEDPFFFRSLAEHWPQVQTQAVPAAQRAKDVPAFGAELPRFLAAHGGTAAEYRFFPYEGRYGTCTLALTAAGEIVDAIACEKH